MRILEKSKDVLTLQNSAIDSIFFWFGNIGMVFMCPLFIKLLSATCGLVGVCYVLFVLLVAMFVLALTNIWASDVVKFCSFNKALSKVTIKYYGLQAKIKDFPLRNVRAVEVRKSKSYEYGAVFESAQVWLVTWNYGAIPLTADRSGAGASFEAIANQIREFLSLKGCSI